MSEDFRLWSKIGQMESGQLPNIPTQRNTSLQDPASALHYIYQTNEQMLLRMDKLIELLTPQAAPQESNKQLVVSPSLPSHPYSFIREQYNIVERKHLILTKQISPENNYQIINQDAAIALLTTDSIIAFDTQALSSDSPRISGTTTVYGTLTIGLQFIQVPEGQLKTIYAVNIDGPGNLWILLGD